MLGTLKTMLRCWNHGRDRPARWEVHERAKRYQWQAGTSNRAMRDWSVEAEWHWRHFKQDNSHRRNQNPCTEVPS